MNPILVSFSTIFFFLSLVECHEKLVAKNFCAEITSKAASKAVGQFSMQIYQGMASYSFSLDLSSFSLKTCNLSNGLVSSEVFSLDFILNFRSRSDNCQLAITRLHFFILLYFLLHLLLLLFFSQLYHIHTSWTNTSTSSSAGSDYCGAANTGGHYDPNLACGYSSSSCLALNRSSAAMYECNHDNYDAGLYALCQIGDLSGKFGTIYGSNSLFTQSSVLYDVQPPYVSNYLQSNKLSSMWSSIVFHCADNARLVCAKFELITPGQSSICTFPAISDYVELKLEISILESVGFYKSIGLLALSLIGFVLLALILGWYKLIYRKRREARSLSSQDESNRL